MALRVLITCKQMQAGIERFLPEFAAQEIEIELPEVVQQMDESDLLAMVPFFDGIIAGDDPLSAAVLLLVVLHGWVATLLLAESYRSASSLMPIIGAGCALSAAAKVLAQPSLANKHSKAPLVGRTFGVVAAAITIPIMVANWGLFGAAVASPIYFGIEAFAMAAFAIPWWKNLGRQTDPSCLCMNQSIFVGNVPEG